MRIAAVGDIMPGGVLAGVNDGYVSEEIIEILSSADVRVGTLETAVGNAPTFYEEKMKRKADVIYTKDADLVKLKHLKMDIVSLANNHFYDLGPEGAAHAIELLDGMGILHIGAGRNRDEAMRPAVIEKDGKRIAFIAFCDTREENVGWCPFATETTPGIAPMKEDLVLKQIRKCKAQYDYVVVMPHWGREYQIAPTKEVYRMASLMLGSGADLILGGHTHCVQPIWNTNRKSAVYSMGNFLFPDRLLSPPRSTYYHNRPIDISTLPVTDGYPRHVDGITFKIWKPMARVGMIVEISINENGVNAKPFYTHLTKDNYVEIGECPREIKKVLKRYKCYLLTGHYLLVLRLHSFIRTFISK